MKTKLTVLRWMGFTWFPTTFEELPINKSITIKIVDDYVEPKIVIPLNEVKK